MLPQIKIALIDDEQLIRKGIASLLEREKNFNIVFEGENGNDLINYLRAYKNHPNVVLLDIRMEGLNGIETTKIVSEKFPDIKVIILSSLRSNHLIEQITYYGASAYLAKNSNPQLVVETINRVYSNGIYFDSEMMKIIINMKSIKNNKSNKLFCELSDREVEILNLICNQYNTKEIAEKLYLSERTIDGHRKRMLEKTNSKNVVGLIVWGIKNQVLIVE